MSACLKCRQSCSWPIGSLKHTIWLAKHDCRLLRPVASATHTFRCVVCGLRGDCDGECDRDPAAHVHFADACWEIGPRSDPSQTSANVDALPNERASEVSAQQDTARSDLATSAPDSAADVASTTP